MQGTETFRMPDTMRVVFPASPEAPRASTWVRGPVWDGVWMLNALWLLPTAIWLSHVYADPESSLAEGRK
jgi:hypothetical protein